MVNFFNSKLYININAFSLTLFFSLRGKPAKNQSALKQFKSTITNFYSSCTNTFNATTNYCASEIEILAQNCSRNLGDPIMYYENKTWYLYGLLGTLPSSNNACSSSPLIYTQIPSK